jgi:hypothetical protein
LNWPEAFRRTKRLSVPVAINSRFDVRARFAM